jgi:putative DNA primase/helicase
MDDELDDIDEAAEKSKPSAPTVDQFRAEIEEMVLPAGHESAHLDSLLPRIAQYEPHETDMLLKALQARYPVRPGIQTLRDSVKRIRTQLAGRDGEEVTDIERELVDEMLEEHFAGGAHLKRIGRAFWLYETGVWRMIGDEPIRGLLQESIIRLRETRPDDAAQLVAAIGENKTTTLVGSLNSMLTARLARASELSGNSDPLLLLRRITQPVVNCLNCELHFDYHGNMTVEDHNPEHFYTMQVNTDYDPGADCPEWDRFMRMVFAEAGDPEDMIRHLEELGGYIISMSKWLKVWVLFHGATNTGKSTLLNVFKELLGKSCVAMELGKFGVGSDFADYNLVNALLLADDDFDKSASLPDGFIKKISEEKRITANVKFKDAITFQSRALPLVCANHWPVTKDVSDAFHERALVFEFLHRIDGPERSDARRDAMLLELPGILNRFIAGLQRLRTRNNWDVPVDAVISHEKWSSQSNQVMQFVDEMLMPGKRVKRSDVWRAYTDWVPHKGFMLRQRELYDRLDMLLGASVKSHGIDVWTGWELRPPPHLDSPHEEL